jgi:hypothetical protein
MTPEERTEYILGTLLEDDYAWNESGDETNVRRNAELIAKIWEKELKLVAESADHSLDVSLWTRS